MGAKRRAYARSRPLERRLPTMDRYIYDGCRSVQLTKAMQGDRLTAVMMTGQLDLRPTAESLMIKEKNRQSRKAVKQIAKDKKA